MRCLSGCCGVVIGGLKTFLYVEERCFDSV